jgi:hypothetical protein
MAIAYLCALGKFAMNRHHEDAELKELEVELNYLIGPTDR